MKAFLIDLTKCVGCHACQIGCKDEHCGNDWAPYAAPQPEVGQFWLKLKQQERGAGTHVRVSYVPTLCNHCENAPCMKAAKNGAVYRREDGLVLIDPVKAKGQKQIVEACPYHHIYWNEALQIPQKCTGCAHLVDRGWPISVPRCMDNCHMGVITFGEKDELGLDGTEEVLHPEYGTKPRVFYRGLPKPFVAATVYDPEVMDVVENATVTLSGEAGTYTLQTDGWGDFWFKNLPEADWNLTVEKDGRCYQTAISTRQGDIGLPDIALS